MKTIYLLLLCTLLYTTGAWAQCASALGDQTTAGTNDTWIGYVYDDLNFVNYMGYINEGSSGNMNFDEGFGGTNNTFSTNGCATAADYFSVRYKLDKTFADTLYTITVGADDGYRLSIDGGSTWVIDDYVDHGYRSTTVTIRLNGLTHLVLEYYDTGGDNRVSFDLAVACIATGDETVYGTNNTWLGHVYDNMDHTFYKGTITEGSSANPYFYETFGGDDVFFNTDQCSVRTQTFSVRYRLQKTFANGTYTFTVGGDDGYRFSTDGGATWIIQNWGGHSYLTTTQTVTLNGTYNLVLEYYEDGGANIVSFDMNFTLLPVQLTSFTGKLQNKQVALNWTTTSNSNTDHFVVERSVNEQAFEAIAQVKGNTATTQYSYTDATSLTGALHYRLKMVDTKGGATYSDVVTVKTNTTGELKIYPTVLNQQTSLNIQAGEAVQQATVIITDMQGRVLQQNNIGTLAAAQKAGIALRATLAKGMYVVTVKSGSNVVLNKTIVVQ